MLARAVMSAVIGGALGYGYHRVVGCRTGACPLTSNAWSSTMYGAFVGFMASGGLR